MLLHILRCAQTSMQEMPQLLQRKSFQGTWIAHGFLMMVLLLFYKTLGRKDGLMVSLKILMLILQLKTVFLGARSKLSLW